MSVGGITLATPTLMTPVTHALVQRVRSEFEEVPGLRLTLHEAARFWQIEPEICVFVLRTLCETGFLSIARDGRYRRV
jgi:hypothetical protein